jgi:hypothetical protein
LNPSTSILKKKAYTYLFEILDKLGKSAKVSIVPLRKKVRACDFENIQLIERFLILVTMLSIFIMLNKR